MVDKETIDISAVILAAGKGTRMNSTERNKVTLQVKGVPMITRTIHRLHDAKIPNIVVVVGFAKESVLELLDPNILVAEQDQQLGTGHALQIALEKVPPSFRNILVLNGDDGFWYSPDILRNLYRLHIDSDAAITICTTEKENPTGLGRIKRNPEKRVLSIVEEKNATDEERKIREVNTGLYIFRRNFLEKYLNTIPRNPVSGEYYATDLISIASENNERVESLKLLDFDWRGVNTPEELKAAEQLLN